MPANELSPRPKKRRRNPVFAQRDARAAMAAQNAPKGSGQVAPPSPPPGPVKPASVDSAKVDKNREALETLPDAELIEKAEVLLPEFDDEWDRKKLIDELLKAGVAG